MTQIEIHVGDPRFDDWEVVRDFEDLESAQTWCQFLEEQGYDAVITADWDLDEYNRGDIALRVPEDQWSEAEEALSAAD